MNQARAYYRGRLVTVEVPKAHADVVADRIADIVGFHIASLSPAVPLEQQLRSLAFDCYSQGLFDGAQVAQRIPHNAQEVTDPQGSVHR